MPYPTQEDAKYFPWVGPLSPLTTPDEGIVANPIPVAVGTAFVVTPYVVGAAIVVFGPPPLKPVGASMLIPGPSDPILFAMGYYIGEQFVESWS